jgi:diaminohydroxyphosphoribosylaminopyrimidine deaminase/5-amino-6-(5-phosphoribosylamino)uracil reductase
MQRCLYLAAKGAGYVAPNPMVGAVLVYKDRVIGEGWHKNYGQAHAEVNCIDSVQEKDRHLVSSSVLYVSLEPCAHYGKTPPCADLIIRHQIPKVVIGCSDPFEKVDGKGIEKLQATGVEVITGVLEKECREINKRFFTFHARQRPFIILKWAQSADQKIAGADDQRVLISNDYSNRLVHQWRTEEAAILVGTNTARSDDPQLTARLWPGPSPLRIVIDKQLRLPLSLHLFDCSVKTIVFNEIKNEESLNLQYYQVSKEEAILPQLMKALYGMNIQSVLVEGGAHLLQSFMDAGYWDEARIITNTELVIGEGLPAPVLQQAKKIKEQQFFSDTIEFYKHDQ